MSFRLDGAVAASLGCGNPPRTPTSTRASASQTWAPAGASTSCCPPAASVRPPRAYGLDMIEEMLVLALANAPKAVATNVESFPG
ncbi:hypothetical protein SATRM34S_06987 [Streptomyces atroolivaceus]